MADKKAILSHATEVATWTNKLMQRCYKKQVVDALLQYEDSYPFTYDLIDAVDDQLNISLLDIQQLLEQSIYDLPEDDQKDFLKVFSTIASDEISAQVGDMIAAKKARRKEKSKKVIRQKDGGGAGDNNPSEDPLNQVAWASSFFEWENIYKP